MKETIYFAADNMFLSSKIPPKADIDTINKLAYIVKKKVVDSEGINHLRDLINRTTRTNIIVI